jgi:hypothetical protein
MTDPAASQGPRAPLFARRNLFLALAGLGTIGAGYGILASGSPSLAAVLLVLGYVVLMPLALLA